MSNATKTQTSAQRERSAHRDHRDGKFIKNPCEFCGKGAPVSAYFSDERSGSTGFGVVLHEKCADRLSGPPGP